MTTKLCFLTFFVFVCVGAHKFNVLLIIVDDLRDALGCYGDRNAHTPNIDRLSNESAIFTQAFAQQALCAPSRNSLLTSRRPDTLQLYDFYSYWRNVVGNYTTLPQHLKNHGYRTKSIGKVFHPGISSNGSDDSPYSWTDEPFHPYTNRFKNKKVCSTNKNGSLAQNLICPVKISEMPRRTLPDLENVREARRFLRSRARDEKPFFLALGLQKPHIPLKYPRKYLRFHPLHKFNVPEPYSWPKNISNIAYNPWIDLRKREDVQSLNLKFPWEKIPVEFARRIIQSYYAAVTYIDDLIGQVLQQLENSFLRQRTIVLLTSDHGWSLGEHGVWAKYSNFEVAVRVPLLLSIPGVTFDQLNNNAKKISTSDTIPDIHSPKCLQSELDEYEGKESNYRPEKSNFDCLPPQNKTRINLNNKKGMVIDSIVELVDIFPTIADLTGFPIAPCTELFESSKMNIQKEKLSESNEQNTCTEGMSLVPLINAEIKSQKIHWKTVAFWQYPRPGINPTVIPNSDEPRLKDIVAMGYSVRTIRYRYTAWVSFSAKTKKPNWNELIAEELYDIFTDSNELKNQAACTEFAAVKKRLLQLLQQQKHNIVYSVN